MPSILNRAVITLLFGSSLMVAMEETIRSQNQNAHSEWYEQATKRNLTNPVLLRFAYASRNPASAGSQRMIVMHTDVWGLVGPQTFTLYDEAATSMDQDQSKTSAIIIRAPNQHVYVINFEKASDSTHANPLFKVILERIKDTSGHNQSLQHKDHMEVIRHLTEYRKNHTQVTKEHIDTLEGMTAGNILTILADDSGIYLSKGNR